MAETNQNNETEEQNETPRYRVRLPTFIGDEEVGLGDVLKRAASYIGVKPCAGCERRTEALNRWATFTGRTK
jgi:hypothetical protein